MKLDMCDECYYLEYCSPDFAELESTTNGEERCEYFVPLTDEADSPSSIERSLSDFETFYDDYLEYLRDGDDSLGYD